MNKKLISITIVFLFLICGINTLAMKSNISKNDINKYYSENGLGLLPRTTPLPESETLTGDTPDSFDWRNVNGEDWTTSIKEQGGCGSCYAFASIAALESIYKIKILNEPSADIDLSEQLMVSCGSSCMGRLNIDGCNGAHFEYAFEFMKHYGSIREECFDYSSSNWIETGQTESCDNKCNDWKDNRIFIGRYNLISQNTESIKNALINYGPLTTSMNVYKDFRSKNFDPHYPNEDVWSNNVYYHKEGGFEGYHVVTIVGYQDDSDIHSGGYWICKNSWGKDWGITKDGEINNGDDGGWFRIAYDDFDGDSDECFINYETYYFDDIYESGVIEESKLELVEDEINLGKIECGKDYEFSFTVKNTGDLNSELDWGVYDSPESCGSSWSYKDKDGQEFSYDMDGLQTPKNKLKPEDGEFTVHVSFQSTYNEAVEITGNIVLKDRDKEGCIECNSQKFILKFSTKTAKSRFIPDTLFELLKPEFKDIFNFLK